MIHQVGSVAEAKTAADAGVDVIIAQGVEAGGHVRGEVSTLTLVPRVVGAVSPTPVTASGGIADARGLVAVLALGAQGAVFGTKFLAAEEARTHPVYRQRILDAREGDTIRTTLFGYSWPNARTAFSARRSSNSGSLRKHVGTRVVPTSRWSDQRRLAGRGSRSVASWASRLTRKPLAISTPWPSMPAKASVS